MNVSTASAAKMSRLRTSLTVVRLILVESADSSNKRCFCIAYTHIKTNSDAVIV